MFYETLITLTGYQVKLNKIKRAQSGGSAGNAKQVPILVGLRRRNMILIFFVTLMIVFILEEFPIAHSTHALPVGKKELL